MANERRRQWPDTVDVAGIAVMSGSSDEVVRLAAEPATSRARLVFALHVGGLLTLHDPAFLRALDEADLVYADGAAVVLLAKASGHRQIRRSSTTDVGVPVLQEVSRRLGRSARVALVGGPEGLAPAAGQALEAAAPVEVVLAVNGYFEDDSEVLRLLKDTAPDIVLVGLGMPKEALWAYQRRTELPAAVVLTCGGWFGFLTGTERRAPKILQKTGLEWTYRLSQDFARLRRRYLLGALVVARLLPGQLGRRGRVGELQSPSEDPNAEGEGSHTHEGSG